VTWERVNLGFVSAYVLARGGEATIVDTGVSGSEGDIETSLGALGLGWDDVGHVIITHLHPDHQGSLPAVMNLAPGATGYAGAGDIPRITAPRELVAVGDGDSVFDLDIIATPGHTPGHISVLDQQGGILVAGDALNGSDGRVIGANPDFTSDIVAADESVAKLALFTYGTALFGHGEPVVGDASGQVAALAASI
jgi:glyoxylase-like metal-dependent hydrolase (beta-lactamase superfamily II)